MSYCFFLCVFFFKQKTAYDMRISDWSSDVCSSDLDGLSVGELQGVTVDEEGFVKASFSNGDNQVLGKIALANFSNPTGLRQLGNSTWASSGISGAPA